MEQQKMAEDSLCLEKNQISYNSLAKMKNNSSQNGALYTHIEQLDLSLVANNEELSSMEADGIHQPLLHDKYKSKINLAWDRFISRNNCKGSIHNFLENLSKLKGILCTIMSALCFCAGSFLVKSTQLHPFQVTFFRLLVQLLLGLFCVSLNKFQGLKEIFVSKTVFFLLWLRTTCAVIAFYGEYYAYQNMPMGDATAIVNATPIVILILEFLWLKERPSITEAVVIPVCMVGCVLVAHPSFIFGTSYKMTLERALGLAGAFEACIALSVGFLAIRKVKNVTAINIVFSMGVWGTIESSIVCGASGVWELPAVVDWVLVIGIGFLGFSGQMFLTQALKVEKAALVSIIRCLDIVLAFVFDMIFFSYVPNIWSVLGGTMILAGAITISTRKLLKFKETSLDELAVTKDVSDEENSYDDISATDMADVDITTTDKANGR